MTQPRSIYLTRRNPAMTRSQFVTRWRQHGALGMAQPRWVNIARYVQCDVIAGLGIEGVSDDYDGVGNLWFRSEEHRTARNLAVASQAIMEADEQETFEKPIKQCRQYCVEQSRIAQRSGTYKLVRFVWRPAETDAAEFAATWSAKSALHEDAVLPLVEGRIVNVPLPGPDGLIGLACDIIEEYWFSTVDGIRAAQAIFLANGFAAGLGTRTIAVVTQEAILSE